ncbi:hypothetical protein OPT61_g8120 [Boeremia exigua]|uniref:Uncharacterized protein n=1 Tax=Boeremia exigua TaxID=749465 RepID=A0ACC2HZI6_9PLEO|nr:hypothetical protein OPT61_g8120 [Boeremia exigua]
MSFISSQKLETPDSKRKVTVPNAMRAPGNDSHGAVSAPVSCTVDLQGHCVEDRFPIAAETSLMWKPVYLLLYTIDLQDKTSPTAQDHSNQPEHPAPLGIGPAAPHQQASLRSIEDERNAEEARLQKAWNTAGTSLSEDPGSDDERTVVNHADDNKSHQNGGLHSDDDDDDMQDADVEEDMDDDMLDKISSSPSIDDGGYSSASYSLLWPTRRDSLTPQSSPVIASSASSSPFTTTPVHFPIPVTHAGRPLSVPVFGAQDLSTTSHHVMSAFTFQFSQHQSTEHHHGEYTWTRTTNGQPAAIQDGALDTRTRQLALLEQKLQLSREDSQASVISDMDEEHARKMLQPIRSPSMKPPEDPFVGPNAPVLRSTNGTPPPAKHPDDEEDSWTTDSDADSWDEELDNDDDASNDVSFSDDPRFVDSGWGGECLREIEDIDFEFVYALHTFVATVEGQANATKGDTMVLLDDSNSYWWLVRVVKDSSIGYLPAEHIETPTERLARLNKHRNIDLSATMLGDTAEKTKNPLKKAMRRRNAKTVQFGAPTYVEASDYDYSSDEEGGELFGGPEPKQAQQQQQQEQEQQQQQQAAQKSEADQNESLEVKPLKLGGIKKVSSEESRSSSEEAGKDDEKSRTSDEIFDRPLDQKVSRNGTLRNTDSFFKDENTETRKITLTPNLLRDDSSTSTTGSRERGPSLESLEKNGFADKVKDGGKKKDKKSGMLSGLFKRKDKKDKDSKSDIDTVEADLKKAIEKPEQTSPQTAQAKPAEAPRERPSEEQTSQAPSRQSSKGKLQKQHRARTDSPIKTKSILKTDSPMEAPLSPDEAIDARETAIAEQQASSTMRIVSPDQAEAPAIQPTVQERVKSPESQGVMAAISSKNPFRSNTTTDSAPKPEKVRKAKERVVLDDFDSSADESDDPFADPDAQDKAQEQTATEPVGRLSESPVHVSVADAQPTIKETAASRDQESDAQHPPGLTGDNSSADTSSRVSTPDLDAASPDAIVPEKLSVAAPRSGTSPSPTHLSPTTNLIPPPSRTAPVPLNVNTSPSVSPIPVSSESTTLPAWSDASLRSYLDDGSEIRDLLLMINDTNGVVPVGKDHPLMSGLFVEETKAAQNLSSELDRLLAGLMDNRMKRHGSGASKKSQLSQMSKASTTAAR